MNADKYNTFKDGALTLAQGTTYSDVIKIGKQGLAYGLSKLRAQVTTAVTSAGAATVQFVLEKDNNESFTSKADVLDSGALAKATLVDNYDIWDRYMEELSWQEASGDTYLRVKIVVATADLTAGAVQIELKGLDSQNIT
jgi:hypothetical protein